jgi:hypothetical protein
MRTAAVLGLMIGISGAVAAAACSAVLGFKELTLLPPDGGTDADAPIVLPDAADAADAGDVVEEASPDSSCEHVRWPDPPLVDDGADASVMLLALKTLDLGVTLDQGDPIGFDLDGVCTCPGPESCLVPMGADPTLSCDKSGGRDTSANRLLKLIGTLDPGLSQTALQRQVTLGRFGILLHILDYNGLANDTSVYVEIYDSPGTQRGDAGTPLPPAYDGNDVWLVYPDSVLTPGGNTYVGKYADHNAYVTNHVLVAHIDPAPITIRPNVGSNDNPLIFTLSDVHLTGTLTPDGSSFRIDDGVMGARWPANEALLSFATLTDLSGNSICGNSSIYQGVASEVCAARDIVASPSGDNMQRPCDSISMAVGFAATAARFGTPPFDPGIVPGNCPNPWMPTCP